MMNGPRAPRACPNHRRSATTRKRKHSCRCPSSNSPRRQPSPEPATVAPPPPPASVAKTGTEAAGGWAIQVGRFSQQQNAQGLRDRLKKAGYAAFLKEDRTDSTRSWRVLVGPLKTRSDAEKVRDELATRRQLKGFVIENSG